MSATEVVQAVVDAIDAGCTADEIRATAEWAVVEADRVPDAVTVDGVVLLLISAGSAAGCIVGIGLGVLLARAAQKAAVTDGGCAGVCTLAQLPRNREVVIRHRPRRRTDTPPDPQRATPRHGAVAPP